MTHTPLTRSVFVASLLALAAVPLGATDAHADRGALAAEANVRVGVGEWTDLSNPGAGISLSGRYLLARQIEASARIGYIVGVPTRTTIGGFEQRFATNELPVLIGGRYSVSQRATTPYLEAELGVLNLTTRVRNDLASSSQTQSRFALSVAGGYKMDELHGRLGVLYVPAGDNIGDDLFGIWLSVGFDFVQF